MGLTDSLGFNLNYLGLQRWFKSTKVFRVNSILTSFYTFHQATVIYCFNIFDKTFRLKLEFLISFWATWQVLCPIKLFVLTEYFYCTDNPNSNPNKFICIPVPPKTLVIYDDKRRDVATLSEPYNEGSNINLICEAEGGELPAVSNSTYNVSIKKKASVASWKWSDHRMKLLPYRIVKMILAWASCYNCWENETELSFENNIKMYIQCRRLRQHSPLCSIYFLNAKIYYIL